MFFIFVLISLQNLGKSKKTANVENSTSREIKKGKIESVTMVTWSHTRNIYSIGFFSFIDVHDVNKQTKTTATNNEKHTESKKALEEENMMVDKKSDASVKDVVKVIRERALYCHTIKLTPFAHIARTIPCSIWSNPRHCVERCR